MNKVQLSEAVANRTGVPTSYVVTVLDALIAAIADELVAGRRVGLSNLGTFLVREEAGSHTVAGKGEVPSPRVAPSHRPAFVPAAVLSAAVNRNGN